MQKFRLVGTQGSGAKETEAHVHPFQTANGVHAGGVVLTQPFLNFRPEIHAFLNDTFGNAMNQNISFGAIASVMHDGGTTASADTGTADTNTVNKLIQAGQNFNTTCVVGMSVHNTTDNTYGNITAVDSDTSLSLSADVFPDGDEAFIIDAVWTGTAVQGTWNFADSGAISLTGGDNGDEASIDANTNTSYDMTNFTAFTGKVDLDVYNEENNDFVIAFDLNGVQVGNSVLLNDFIDPGDFSEQNFVIPKADLGLTTQTINGLTLQLIRIGGSKPTLKFDDLHLEASGTPAVFKVTTPLGTRFHITGVRFRLEDNIASTLADGTLPGLDPSTILGVAALTNGIIFRVVRDGISIISLTFSNLGDFFTVGSNLINQMALNTKTHITLFAALTEPIVLEGDAERNFISMTINDDLSGLTKFTAFATGSLEI